MNQEQFEDNIKKTFSSHQVPLDTDALWGAIETDLPTEEKRKPFFFWFFFGISGMFLIGAITFFQYDKNSSNHTKKPIEIVNHLIENKPTISNQKSITTTIQTTSVNTKPESQKTKLSSLNTNQKPFNKLINERTAKTNLTQNINGNKSNHLRLNILQKETQSIENPQKLTESPPLAASTLDKEIIVEESPTIRFNNLNQLTLKWSLLKNTITTKPIVVPPSYPKWRVFAAIHGGISFINKTIKTNNTGIDSYTTLRKESESPLLSYQFSALIGLQHQKTKWYIKSGFQYQQLNEIFDYEEINDRTLYMLTGDNKTERTTRTIQHYNQINILEIPIIVGKSFRNRHRISLELEAGFATSLSLNANGRFVNEDIEVANLNTTMFQQNNWSVITAVEGAYKLSPKTSLTLGVAYQQYLGSIRTKESVSKDQYRLLNVRLGLKKVF